MELFDFVKKQWIWILIITLVLWKLYKPKMETFSQATIQQLTAVGAQDTYLTRDAWKYIPDQYFDGNKMGSAYEQKLAHIQKASKNGSFWDGSMPNICDIGQGPHAFPYNYRC